MPLTASAPPAIARARTASSGASAPRATAGAGVLAATATTVGGASAPTAAPGGVELVTPNAMIAAPQTVAATITASPWRRTWFDQPLVAIATNAPSAGAE